MWYFILCAVFAIWAFVDAKKRKNHVVGWPLATLFLGPIVLPVYIAKRNLKEGEVREGGTGWNVLKNFALFWTITMGAFALVGMVGISEVSQEATTGAEQLGVALGATLGLGMIAGLWFVFLVAALVLGMFLKKSSIIERGPTGNLTPSAVE